MSAEADQLREDIRVLRTMIDAALDNRVDRVLLLALAEVLHERREQLEALELCGGRGRRAG